MDIFLMVVAVAVVVLAVAFTALFFMNKTVDPSDHG